MGILHGAGILPQKGVPEGEMEPIMEVPGPFPEKMRSTIILHERWPVFTPKWFTDAVDVASKISVVLIYIIALALSGFVLFRCRSHLTLEALASAARALREARPNGAYMFAAWAIVASAAAYGYRRRRPKNVMLLDFEAWRGTDQMKLSRIMYTEGSRRQYCFGERQIEFQSRVLGNAGLSDHTFWPPGLMQVPIDTTLPRQREEMQITMLESVQGLLAKTGVDPREIDVLVTNASMFSPSPSLASMIVNHFGLRTDVDSYNLGGMGCSVGPIGAGLAIKLLRGMDRPGLALVVTAESMLGAVYRGDVQEMLLPNTLFRMGACATLYTTRPKDRKAAKYDACNYVRVHLGADKKAFGCAFRHEDSRGINAMDLTRDLVNVAARALTLNMTLLGRQVLPVHELLGCLISTIARRSPRVRAKYREYVPSFHGAVDHFCIHAGGRAVVDGLGQLLELDNRKIAPAANALYWYGNTSSVTVFYSLGFAESVQGIKKGEKVWQVGIGSGFKCNSIIWKARRNINTTHRAWYHVHGKEDEAMSTFDAIKARSDVMRAERVRAREADALASPAPPTGVADVVERARALAGERAETFRRRRAEELRRAAWYADQGPGGEYEVKLVDVGRGAAAAEVAAVAEREAATCAAAGERASVGKGGETGRVSPGKSREVTPTMDNGYSSEGTSGEGGAREDSSRAARASLTSPPGTPDVPWQPPHSARCRRSRDDEAAEDI